MKRHFAYIFFDIDTTCLSLSLSLVPSKHFEGEGKESVGEMKSSLIKFVVEHKDHFITVSSVSQSRSVVEVNNQMFK